MPQTVIGLFVQAEAARQAEMELMRSGFDPASIDVAEHEERLVAGPPAAAGAETAAEAERGDEESAGDKVKRFFKHLFGRDDEAERYTEVARHSEALVTVHADTDDEAQRAAHILDDAGALDVEQEAAGYGLAGAGTGEARTEAMPEEREAMPVIEEELAVGTRTVETGGAHLRSRIVAHPVEEELRLRRERVDVERIPVDRPATEAELHAFGEGEIEMTEHAEVPVVSKEARVVEEVAATKQVEEHTETIRDTERKTEVEVDVDRGGEGGIGSDRQPR